MQKIVFALLMLLPLIGDAMEHPEASFEKLKELSGDWKREGSDGDSFYISFTGSAKGSALIENWIHKGKSHSLTIYHLDKDKLLATHYCPQGNQPRLKLEKNRNKNEISFVFQDATNLPSLETSHQHSLTYTIVSENTIIREESYIKAGVVSPSSIKLVRK